MGRVSVISPDGTWGTVDEAELDHALTAGYQLETPDQASGRVADEKFGNRPIAAGLASFGREFTFGGSDLLLTKTGLVEPETLKGLQDAPSNDTAEMVGQGGGLLAGLLLPVGTPLKAASKLGQVGARALAGTGTGIARVAARGAIAGGIEATTYALGQSVSEEALDGDAEINGERILAHAGEALLVGGGIGGAFGVLGDKVSKIFRRPARVAEEISETPIPVREAGEAVPVPTPRAGTGNQFPEPLGTGGTAGLGRIAGMADEGLTKLATKFAKPISAVSEAFGFGALDPEALVLKGLDARLGQVERLSAKGLIGRAPRSLLEDSRYAAAKSPQELANLISDKMDEAIPGLSEPVALFDAAATRSERINGPKLAARIRQEIIKPLGKGTTLNDDVVSRLTKEADAIEGWGNTTISNAIDYRRIIDPQLKWDSLNPGNVKEALQRLRGIVNEEINTTAERIGRRIDQPEAFERWTQANRSYQEMAELSKIASNRLSSKVSNNFFGLNANLWGAGAQAVGVAGAVLSGNPLPLMLPIAAMVVNKWGKDRLPQVLALALARADDTASGRMASRGFHRQVNRVLQEEAEAGVHGVMPIPESVPGVTPPPVSTIPPPTMSTLGPFRDILQKSADLGPAQLFAAHSVLWGLPEYQETLRKAGLAGSDDPEEDQRAEDRARGLEDVQGALEAQQKEIQNAASGFLERRRPGGGRAKAKKPEQLVEEFEELAQMVANPEALSARLEMGDRLAGVAPQAAAQAALAAVRAVEFLHQVMPKRPPPSILPGEDAWRPSRDEADRYQRYAQAVKRPQSVLEDLQRGEVSVEGAEALRKVYPRLTEEITRGYLEVIGQSGKRLTYRQVLNLSTLLGMPLDDSQRPEVAREHQMAFQAAPRPPPAPPSGGSFKPPDTQTQLQRLENGGAR
jgi:hypothetical protein